MARKKESHFCKSESKKFTCYQPQEDGPLWLTGACSLRLIDNDSDHVTTLSGSVVDFVQFCPICGFKGKDLES